MIYVTIDTNILVNAFTHNEHEHRMLTHCITGSETAICFDWSEIISKEYERNVGNLQGYRKWRKRLKERMAIHYCDAGLPNQHKSRLANLGCHEPSDQVFVGVAFHSGKILISEDSDVGKGPKGACYPHCEALKYLTETMEVRVYDAKEACASLWSIAITVG